MALFRKIFNKIWTDPDFQEYSRDERLVFFYVCTNPNITESGIYPLTCKTIAMATDLEKNTVEQILRENRIKNILYDFDNQVIFVANFLRYHGTGRRDLVLRSVYNDYMYIKTHLWNKFEEHYPLYFEKLLKLKKEIDRGAIPSPKHKPIPILNPKPKPKSNPYPNHNSNHTPSEILADEMFEIFENYWHLWNKGPYLHDHEAEQHVAEILYAQCQKERPSDPMGLFAEKVETLVAKYDIKQFTGLHKYWNAAADRGIEGVNDEEMEQCN